MNHVGNKIRKIRELKNIAPKDIADQLDLTPQGYLKIERDEVALSVDRLLKISEIFEMKPEDVLTFDEKYVLQNYGEITGNQLQNVTNNFPEKMKELYEKNEELHEANSKLQEEKNRLLEDKIKWLEEKLGGK